MAFASSLCNIVLNSSLRGRRNLVKQCAIFADRSGNRGARRCKRPPKCARRTGRGACASGRSRKAGTRFWPRSASARRALRVRRGPDPQGARAADRRFRAAPGQSRIWRRQRFDPGPLAGGAGAAMLARRAHRRFHHPVAGMAHAARDAGKPRRGDLAPGARRGLGAHPRRAAAQRGGAPPARRGLR